MASSTSPDRSILGPLALWRENPGPPERPEREGGGSGGNRWFFGFLAAFLIAVFLGRPLGATVLVGLWAVALIGFFVYSRVKRLGKRKNPKS